MSGCKRSSAFSERYDRACTSRLAGLSPGLSTRLGAALRHAGALAGQTSTYRKLIIVLTDGEPSDIDTDDPMDLVEDARRAVKGLHGCGIDCFGIVLGMTGMESAARIFRARQHHAGQPDRRSAAKTVRAVFPACVPLTAGLGRCTSRNGPLWTSFSDARPLCSECPQSDTPRCPRWSG